MSARRWRLAGGILLAAALAVAGVVGAKSEPDAGGTPTRRVERGDLTLAVAVAGTLSAVESVRLGPPAVADLWNYKIAWMVSEGTTVAAGQPVLRFDPSELDRKLLEAVARRDSASAELAKRRTELDQDRRDRELAVAEAEARLRKAELKADVPADLTAAVELAEARIDLDLARRETADRRSMLELAERKARAELASLAGKARREVERVAEIERDRERLTVRAPRAGTVILVAGRRGEKKKIGDQVWQQEQVIELPDLEAMRADGQVAEAEAGRLAIGQAVKLTLDAHPDVSFTGRLATLHRIVSRRSPADPQKVVRVEIELPETDVQRMRPGMRFQGSIEVDRARGVLLAPAEAVFGSPTGPIARRRGWFGFDEVAVGVGRRNDDWVEILSGLAEGDLLALSPASAARGPG